MAIQNPALEQEISEKENRSPGDESAAQIQELIDKCDKSMLINGIIFIAGVAITLITYTAVADKGGSYVVAWGAIVFGAINCFRAYDAKDKLEKRLKAIQGNKEEETESQAGS